MYFYENNEKVILVCLCLHLRVLAMRCMVVLTLCGGKQLRHLAGEQLTMAYKKHQVTPEVSR